MNEQPTEPGNTEFILPIQCPYCQKELNLGMLFSLLPPEKKEEDPIVPTNSLESNHEPEKS